MLCTDMLLSPTNASDESSAYHCSFSYLNDKHVSNPEPLSTVSECVRSMHMYVYHVLYACTYMYSKYNAPDNNRRSWLRLQISLVMLSVSPSTVDCNSTTFQA